MANRQVARQLMRSMAWLAAGPPDGSLPPDPGDDPVTPRGPVIARLDVGPEVLAIVEKKIAAAKAENERLCQERDEAREVARQLLTIARAHGARPFGLEKAPWLEKP